MNIPTPHNAAQKGDIARRVLMPERLLCGQNILQKLIWKLWCALIQ